MEFKFDNSEKLLFEYFDELFDQYLHRKQREQVESFLMRLRYEEEKFSKKKGGCSGSG